MVWPCLTVADHESQLQPGGAVMQRSASSSPVATWGIIVCPPCVTVTMTGRTPPHATVPRRFCSPPETATPDGDGWPPASYSCTGPSSTTPGSRRGLRSPPLIIASTKSGGGGAVGVGSGFSAPFGFSVYAGGALIVYPADMRVDIWQNRLPHLFIFPCIRAC